LIGNSGAIHSGIWGLLIGGGGIGFGGLVAYFLLYMHRVVLHLLIISDVGMIFRIIIITNDPRKDIFIRSGLVLSIAIALHNFPSGIALGTSLVSTPDKFGTFFPLLLSTMLGISVGTILYVTFFEILKPEWQITGTVKGLLGLLFGLCLGGLYIVLL
jgi:ZIP family zinc transporter